MTQSYSPVERSTILMPSGATDHLHFVCCNPVFYPAYNRECVLLVNISSIKQDLEYDTSCILQVGDHPFISKPSYIYYRKADIFGIETIKRSVAQGDFTIHQDCNESVFQRILDGFKISDEVRRRVLQFYEKYCR